MGVRASWICVKGAAFSEVLELLGLVETGEIAFNADAERCYALLPSGWSVLQGPEDFVHPDRLAAASTDCDALGIVASESVMVSEAHGYREGQKVWSVTHHPERSDRDLQVEGTPPAALRRIGSQLMRLQDEDEEGGVDYLFDAPLKLMQDICGVRLDRDFLPGETVFKVVEPLMSGKAGRKQEEIRQRHEALTARVRSELYPAARELGFVPAVEEPRFLENRFPSGAAHVMVRSRDGLWEDLQFIWGLKGEDEPFVEIYFFRREGDRQGRGRNGVGRPPPVQRRWLDRLFGPKPEPETLDTLMPKVRQVLLDIDRYLKDGTVSERITPPVFEDN